MTQYIWLKIKYIDRSTKFDIDCLLWFQMLHSKNDIGKWECMPETGIRVVEAGTLLYYRYFRKYLKRVESTG